MMVLSRRSNESIVIGGYGGSGRMLKVTVLGVSGGKVKLGIEAADDIPVHRWEVWERICARTLPDSAVGADNASTLQ